MSSTAARIAETLVVVVFFLFFCFFKICENPTEKRRALFCLPNDKDKSCDRSDRLHGRDGRDELQDDDDEKVQIGHLAKLFQHVERKEGEQSVRRCDNHVGAVFQSFSLLRVGRLIVHGDKTVRTVLHFGFALPLERKTVAAKIVKISLCFAAEYKLYKIT
jgi:hypothetical protein